MRHTLLLVMATLMLVGCCSEQPSRHPKWTYNSTIYELNTRQATQEGTFAAAENLLPELRENGIDIIWVMPCQPIGVITRKGTLGSYYSIVDYCQINPEFGTRADFEHFLAKAHKMGFKVILDWVANHTAPDSEWTKNHFISVLRYKVNSNKSFNYGKDNKRNNATSNPLANATIHTAHIG